ncbi:zinc-dependent metalloprotease [Bacteroides helcogenes]|uniref:Peptidase M10A and M12B matrixin and adamalysin n=1 Tax=Bacteroides helcogenes (strain ATCC 35417 / DSM 20613 / JCM 6297 / CCUG 15421 / P 36-108) TaxID=693979 RepID=E6SQD2_BACT6|nr:zinc-dependent metalloprotease [Bacteroides helcogenes]ADV44979.1 peptidase M10A and M12B matrixin and adamalysin [Bacteroides helcogenes P 36-108]MDY5239838.1 zinc-dependent metalloprotease [Bacteroides helcogenes]
MRLKAFLPIMVITGVLMCGPTVLLYAGQSDFVSPETMGWFRKKKKSEVRDSVRSKDSYEKLTGDGAIVCNGMFNVYRKKSDFYFEVPTQLLGRDMLVVNKLQRVPSELNEAGVNRGTNYENQMIRFELDKGTGKLLVRQSRPLPLTPDKDAIRQSVLDNYISPLIAGFKIEAFNKDSTAVVVKVNDIYDGTETSINNVFTNINLGTSAIKNLSRILSIKSFENNVVATSELTTKVTEGTTTVYVTVEVTSSLLLLPEKPMMGRLDSPRVGYFTNPLLSFSDGQQRVDKKSFITRWRLEPKIEDRERYLRGELVEPAKPIVFYIENSTPRRWRKYIMQGIEDWQVAFERAGFKNAIIAKELTDSMNVDKDDVNYSVLTYAASTKANAMGPSILDPRSGEILEADIMWWHNVLGMLQEWITVQTGVVRPEARSIKLSDELMGDAMRFVACHEVGHSLGLRHNMIASWAFPTDSLRSRTFTDRMNSTSSSIMDYARFNYVAQPGDGVTALSPHIGPYDLFAIEYGYRWYGKETPEAEKDLLADFLNCHTDRLYKYSEAQDVRDAVDPRAQIEDLGDDAIHSSLLGIENLKRVVPQIIRWTTTGEKGQTYEEASRLYYAVINQWNNYLYHVLANIGGIYLENTTVGDGQKTYIFVEKEKQQAAMKFLLDQVLTYPKWLFDAEVGEYTYLLRNTPLGVVENAPTQVLKNAQSYILWDLLSNNRLMRMLENESVNGKKAFTVVELMDGLHRSIFATTEHGILPDVMTRALQKNFVDALITAAAESEGVKINRKLMNCHFLLDNQMPLCSCDEQHMHRISDRMGAPRELNFYGSQINRVSDAISVKRGELLRIKDLLQSRLGISDIATKYHYKDLILRINTALGIK